MAWQGQSGAEDSVGGVSAEVRMDATPLAADMARVGRMLDNLEAKFAEAGTSAAASTSRINAGMGGIGKATNVAGYRLQIFAQAIDDLQYVGEQGLRPILNNLVQISPALGIVAIGFETIRKNQDGLETAAKAIGDYWLGSFEKAEGGTKGLLDAVGSLRDGLKDAAKWMADVVEGWDAMTGKSARVQSEAIAKFVGEGTPENKAAGSAMAGAIDKFGRAAFLDEAVRERAKLDASLRGPGSDDAVREEKSRLLGLIEKAKKGDPNALSALEDRSAGTGLELGPFSPEALARQAQARLEARGARQGRKIEEEMERKAWNEWVGDQDPEDIWKEETPEEKKKAREQLNQKMAANVRNFLQADDEQSRLALKSVDLNQRLMLLANPERIGQTLGGDAYANTFHSRTGLSEEAKRLQAIQEVMEDIRDNDKQRIVVAAAPR